MAVVLHEIVDSDFEYVLKATTTGTNSAASLLDVSAAEGAATDPRVSIVGIAWSVAAQTDILWDATSNVVALSLSGSGNMDIHMTCPQFQIMEEVVLQEMFL